MNPLLRKPLFKGKIITANRSCFLPPFPRLLPHFCLNRRELQVNIFLLIKLKNLDKIFFISIIKNL